MTSWLLVLVLLAGGAAAQVSQQTNQTFGDCSPNIVGNTGTVTIHINRSCNGLEGLVPLRSMEARGAEDGPPPDTGPTVFERRVSLSRATFTYGEFVQAVAEVQGAIARASGVLATRQSRESVVIGQDRGPGGRIIILGLDPGTLARVVTQPARGFRYLYESPVGAIRRVEIGFQNDDGEKLGEDSGRSLHVVASDARALEGLIGSVEEVLGRQPRWQARLAGVLGAELVIILVVMGPLFILLALAIWGVVQLFRDGERLVGVANVALSGLAGAAWIRFLGAAGSFPALVPDHGAGPTLMLLAWLGGAILLSVAVVALNWVLDVL